MQKDGELESWRVGELGSWEVGKQVTGSNLQLCSCLLPSPAGLCYITGTRVRRGYGLHTGYAGGPAGAIAETGAPSVFEKEI